MNPLLAFGVPSAEFMIECLGWVLVHSLWQFAVVAWAAGVTVRALRRRSAELRYGVLVAAIGVVSIAPVVTWILLSSDDRSDSLGQGVSSFDSELEAVTNRPADARPLANHLDTVNVPSLEQLNRDLAASDGTSEMRPADNAATLAWTERSAALLRPWLAWIVAGWSFGVALCSLRPLVGWRSIWRLQRVGIAPVSDDVLSAMQRVAARLGIRNSVRVAQSTLARVPVVVGYTRPMILLPVSLLTNLPMPQLEAILAHELAHVRRHDFLVNVLQALVETVFFYHPAVWWLSHRIRIEREHCCDDLVVMRLGNPVDYGRALVAIEELRGRGVLLALGAADGSLLSRVRRLAGAGNDRAARSSWSAASLVACCTGALLGLGILGWYGIAETRGDRSPAEVEGSVEPNLEPGGARGPELDDENAVATLELVFFQDRSRRPLPAIVTTSDGETLAVTAGPATVVPDGTPHAIDRAFLTIAGKPPIEVIYDKRRSNTEFCVYRIAGELTSYRLKAPVHVAVGDSLSAIIRNGAGGWRVVPKSATVTGFDRKAELKFADHRFHHKFANLIEVDRKLPEGTPLFKDGRLVGLTLLGSRFVGGQAERSYVVPAERILAVGAGEGTGDRRNDDASGKPAREAPADSLIPDGEESNSSDNRRDPGSKSETLTAELVPKLSGEWILGEFGLEYRVRSETTSLVAGEMPLLFVEVRNRGSLEDMAVEGHQSRHAVVVDGTRYVRNDQPWGGVDVLAPGGKSVTLPFALSNDWKGEAETKAPLQFPPGKHRIVVSLVIAPYSPPPTADDTTVPPRRVQWRTLVTRPIDVEFRSGAWAGPPDSLGVENIRRELFAIPHFHSPTVPLNLRRLVREHQPLAGDYLVKLLNSDDSTFHEAAAVVFGATWDSMNRAQIEHYLHATMTHFVGLRPKYPQRIDTMIGMGTRHQPGYLGLPTDRKYEVKTVTTHYLDGRQIEKPFSYPGLGAQTHWIRTKDLPLGTHTFRLATAYTFTRGSET
jgi:beta-lactamase regulating signal transducer with metallopeptidase domain